MSSFYEKSENRMGRLCSSANASLSFLLQPFFSLPVFYLCSLYTLVCVHPMNTSLTRNWLVLTFSPFKLAGKAFSRLIIYFNDLCQSKLSSYTPLHASFTVRHLVTEAIILMRGSSLSVFQKREEIMTL